MSFFAKNQLYLQLTIFAYCVSGGCCGCSSVDRVLASEAKGRGFDPRQPRQSNAKNLIQWKSFRRSVRVAKGDRL